MSIATDSRSVKRRIDRYVWQEKSEPLKSLRYFLDENILPFRDAAIVGGMARDFAVRGKRGFKSDIDIVIDAPAEEIGLLAAKLGAMPNRFGGYIYKGPRWKIDFWALETTWAGREGHVSINAIEDVLRATFFDCDAILYGLKSRSVIATENYFGRLRSRTIEINLMPNPSVSGNVLRAIRRILLWNWSAGPKLQEFLRWSLTEQLFEDISAIEKKLYANWTISQFESAEPLFCTLIDPDLRLKFGTSFAQQINLPEL